MNTVSSLTYFVYLGNIAFLLNYFFKSSFFGRLLPVGKQSNRGNSNSLHKREKAGAYLFFNIQGTSLPMPLKEVDGHDHFYTILISLTRLGKSQNKDIGKYSILKAKIY